MSGGHTPWPWRAIGRMVVVVSETHGYDTCVANYSIGGASLDEQTANARVGAAAPELLARLERLVAVIEMAGVRSLMNGVPLGAASWGIKAGDALADARAAIAKATGE